MGLFQFATYHELNNWPLLLLQKGSIFIQPYALSHKIFIM